MGFSSHQVNRRNKAGLRTNLGEKMENKLYVGNLSYTTTDQDLHELFSQAGTVTSAMVMTDRDSGRSKGFGFVEMTNDDDMFNRAATVLTKSFNGSCFLPSITTLGYHRPICIRCMFTVRSTMRNR
mgnify:CR=1 FL=1